MRKLTAFLISERTVMTVILVNTVALILAGFYAEGAPEKRFFETVDYCSVVFFVVEMLIKIRTRTWRGYIGSGWNRFDFFVTVLCLPVLLSPFLGGHPLGWAPIVRTGRLFRLFRLLRFIPDVDRLMQGIRRALRASVGIFLGLFLINLILALTASFFFAKESPEMFGDPARSFYSIFRIFTVEGWNEFPEALETRGGAVWHLLTRLFFGFTVLVCGMLGFSLANAVFIDEMMMDNTTVLEDKVDALQAQIASLEEKLDRLVDGE